MDVLANCERARSTADISGTHRRQLAVFNAACNVMAASISARW